MAAHLLVCVINDKSKIEEILEAFIDLGVTGATIVESQGMGSVLTRYIPLFAGFRQLLSGHAAENKTIFSVVPDEETLDAVISAVESICGPLQTPASGILFSIAVSRVVGLKPELDG